MILLRLPHACGLLVTSLLLFVAPISPLSAKEQPPQFTQVNVQTAREGCTVELDSTLVGKTGTTGVLELAEVEPGDHYVHVRCQEQEGKAYFISPLVGEKAEVRHQEDTLGVSAPDPIEVAQARIQLRRLLQDAAQLRARGNVEEAVRNLRDALRLDPENSDLHRELGITFLLAKDWKRARVEMLEAVRHKPDDADAHNGLGYALEKLEKLEDAVEAYRAATKLEPGDSSYRQHYFGALGKLAAQQAEKKKSARK
jgi:hypothetical protein